MSILKMYLANLMYTKAQSHVPWPKAKKKKKKLFPKFYSQGQISKFPVIMPSLMVLQFQ